MDTSTSKPINWLFLNRANPRSIVLRMTINGFASEDDVGSLGWIDALKEMFKFQAVWSTVEFWQPSSILLIKAVTEDWVKDHPTIRDVASRCQHALSISEALAGSWDANHVHFLITAKGLMEDGDVSESDEEWDFILEFPLRVNHFITIEPPVQIFHPVFQEFLDRIGDPAFKPHENTISVVSELMSTTTEIYPSEENALEKLCPLFTKLLDEHVGQVTSTGTRSPDGLVFGKYGRWIAPLVCIEYKRVFGEGGCDPSTQGAYSLWNFLASGKCDGILEKCCFPSFLLTGGGAYLSIFGVIYTDELVVQQLTDTWVGEATTYEDSWVYDLARVFTSLRLAVVALGKYYSQVTDLEIPAPVSPDPHPHFSPYPTEFEEACQTAPAQRIKFEYTNASRADPTNVTFFAEVKPSGRKLVIKFVDRYGVDAHQLLADAGMAPKLLYCGSLDGNMDVRKTGNLAQGNIKCHGLCVGPVRMVVMERIEGNTMDKASTLPTGAREKTQLAIKKLHDAKLVFGDLRGPNVMFSGEKVLLIDFDWAGKVDEARYPRNLSRKVKWPKVAAELEMGLILADHDQFMLNQLFPK